MREIDACIFYGVAISLILENSANVSHSFFLTLYYLFDTHTTPTAPESYLAGSNEEHMTRRDKTAMPSVLRFSFVLRFSVRAHELNNRCTPTRDRP